MGISGSGVSGVASLASKMGYEVTGCDLQKEGHSKDHLKDIDLLIVTPAVFYQNPNNPELIEGKNRGIVLTWQEFLGKYLQIDRKTICVAGTHGKSTTTAMVGKLLEDTGFDPLVLIGAKVPKWNGSSRFGKGEYFVVEADEFYDNFLNYSPEIIILNNIEFDHPDYFKDKEMLFESFKKFIENLVGEKMLIVNSDSVGVNKLLEKINLDGIKLVKYNLKENNLNLSLKVPGIHNISNALGVVKLGEYLGINKELIKKSLESFDGIGRRLELIGEENGIKVYDDYAHHPTAIAATLEALKSTNSKAKIWAVVEPHGFDRTNALLDLYNSVFKDADKVIIGPIFKARDSKTFGITPKIIANKTRHKDAIGVNTINEIINNINNKIKTGDVILVMGAGNSNLWAKEILKSLTKFTFKKLTTMKVGGKIKYYKEVKNKEELVKQVEFAKKNNLPIFVIGGGSDILVSDKNFNGLVIKYIGDSSRIDDTKITAEAGLDWDKLVEESINNNLQGIEMLSGIPGTVGASPVQNIGAYGQELKDTFFELTAYDIRKNEFVVFKKDDCLFDYRESFFKKEINFQKYIITDVTFKLNKNVNPKITYKSLIKYFEENKITKISLKDIRNAVLRVRELKIEDYKKVPNSGSFFKNPIINEKEAKLLEKKYPEIPLYKNSNGTYKCFAGWFIEKLGWKGKSIGKAKVSNKHALILTNPGGNANFDDVKALADAIVDDVNNKFKIKLEPEVQYINI
ncbi:MAG: UDP-N-acetylmuramate dehydrogenase [Candidatus Woesebacteria bacterium]|nr:UDP-N-acetylmuramate dehydrogenase [Candidatus Woesebacteria bacterium]